MTTKQARLATSKKRIRPSYEVSKRRFNDAFAALVRRLSDSKRSMTDDR